MNGSGLASGDAPCAGVKEWGSGVGGGRWGG